MYSRFKSFTSERPRLRNVAGGFVLFFGILGLVLPLIPGVLLIIIALELYGVPIPFLDHFLKPKVVPVEIDDGTTTL